jgi:hypothetical protein
MTRAGVRPVVVGYLTVPAGLEGVRAARAVNRWRESITEYARREGYALGAVFCDRAGDERGFHATVAQVRGDRAVAVVVPDLEHLAHVGCLAGTDRLTAQRYLRTPLLTVEGSGDLVGVVVGPDAYFTD